MRNLMKATAFSCILTLTGASSGFAAGGKVTFEENVLPVFKTHCANCHNPDKAKGDLNLVAYSALMMGGSSGAVVEAGSVDGSRLYKLMAHLDEPKMPPSGQMVPKKDLDVVKAWIDGGLLERSGSQAKASKKPKIDLTLAAGAIGKPTGLAPMPIGDMLLEPVVHTVRAGMAYSLASSPWGPLLAVGAQRQVLLYNSNTLQLLAVFPFPEGNPYVVRFSRSGSLLLAGGGQAGKSGKVVLWKVANGERVTEVGDETDAVLAADVSADQSLIALAGSGKLVKIYSTKDGELLQTMKKHTDWVLSLEFSPDGVLLATGDRNGGLVVWESQTGREFYTLAGHTAAVTGVSWRSDSNVLVSCSEDTTIRLWEMVGGSQVKSWGAHGGGVLSVQVTHDGRIASCGRDNSARIWTADGNQQKALEAFNDLAVRVTFNHDGSRVFCGEWGGLIRSWNCADGKRVAELTPNPAPIADRLAENDKKIAQEKAELETNQKSLPALFAAVANAKTELAAMQSKAVALAKQEKAIPTKLAEMNAKLDRIRRETEAAKASFAAKSKQAAEIAQSATSLQQALAAAQASEIALQTSVKAATGKEDARKQLAASQTAVKALMQSSKQRRQASDAVAAELPVMKKDLDDRLKQLVLAEADQRALALQPAIVAAQRKSVETQLAPKTAAVKQLEIAAAAAQAKRDSVAAALAQSQSESVRLQRGKVFASVYYAKLDLENRTARLTRFSESAATEKLALEKARLEIVELSAKLPGLEAHKKKFEELAPEVNARVASTSTEVKTFQAVLDQRRSVANAAALLAQRTKLLATKAPADKIAKAAAEKAAVEAKMTSDQVKGAEASLAAKTAELARLTQDASAYQTTLVEGRAKLGSMTKRRDGLKVQVEKLRVRLADDLAAAEQARAELEKHRLSLGRLGGELAKFPSL